MKIFRDIAIWVLLILTIAFFIVAFLMPDGAPTEISYSRMLTEVKNGNVTNMVLDENNGNKVTVELTKEIDAGKGKKAVSYVPLDSYETIVKQVNTANEGNAKIDMKILPIKTTPLWLAIIPNLILIIIVIVFFVFFMQQSQGGGNRAMSFGKSRAKLQAEDKQKVTFDDVAGEDEEKNELMEIVEFLKTPEKFVKLGARIPKGVLLVGPPGTGKTLLAKAMSGEAGVPFFSISGSDFVEMFVGVGASRVRDLFEQAKKHSPCIVFIDEIDAVGRHRGAGLGGGHDEREQTLNQLLVEMDGFGINDGVIIIAATNRPDILDPALLRPGRFDRQVTIGYPDIKGREAVLKVHSKNKPLDPEVNLADIAKTTPGFTPADLENLLNEAALLAARKDKEAIGQDEIKEAIFKVIMGPEKKSRVINDKERKLTAYHEAGHALAVRIVSTTDKVSRISIIPVGRAGGYTVFRPDEDSSYQTKNQLLENIIVSLGGRAAEQVALGEISTGASNDLLQANKVARSMITKYGMSDTLTNLIFETGNEEIFLGKDIGHTKNYSEEVAAKIDNDIKEIIDSSYEKILNILTKNISKLHAVANVMLEKEKIEGEEFEELFMNS